MIRGPLPWPQLLLATWPLWVMLGVLVVLGLIDWHAGRVSRRG